MADEVKFSETVMGKITQGALMNWNGLSAEEAAAKTEELGDAKTASDNVTYGSEMASIEGISQILGLSKEEIEIMTNDINTREAVSQELAEKVKTQLEERGLNASVIEILSVIHDNWVKSNGNKFEDPKRMGKLYQFVDLKLLDFKEAKLDLLFLKPILEANGIELDEVALQQEFLQEQREFLEANGIKDKVDLQEKLGQGASFYPPLEGVTTSKGKTAEPELITDRLQDSTIIESMTEQVAQRAQVPERTKETVSIEQIEEVAETLPISQVKGTIADIRTSEEPTKDSKAVEEQGE